MPAKKQSKVAKPAKKPSAKASAPPYLNPSAPLDARVADLISRLSLEEKIQQMLYTSPEIKRLGIPEYNWWNECLHGVGRAGRATVFPQAIGMAASWDEELMEKVGCAIGDEARAKHHAAVANGDRGQYMGLTFWSPNINIFRDPRWGRGQETYGEDPHLTSRMGVAFVKGLQGDDPKYLKVAANAKHYAVHSGPEADRRRFNACVSNRELFDTYLPAFEALVKEAKVASVMGAYNRVNGEPCCGHSYLLKKLLLEDWKFDGYVGSDCGAIDFFHDHHKVTATPAESAALAVKNGCHLECGSMYKQLLSAVYTGLLTEADIDRAVNRLFLIRMRLGMFDPPSKVKYTKISEKVVSCPKHREMARQMARESIVLLKNEDNLLPLDPSKRILICGPNADALDTLLGNYNGFSEHLSTPLEGIVGGLGAGTQTNHFKGCDLTGTNKGGFGAINWLAGQTDVIVAVMGLSPKLEGEEGDAAESDGSGDRTKIGLPGVQEDFLQALKATGKPVVAIVMGGSPIAMPWTAENIPAILYAWYPGEEGGNAIADVLFGKYSPAGRLPITFVKSMEQLPSFEDYSMKGRTYRYMEQEPLYPFGFGLSYTAFAYSKLALLPKSPSVGDKVTVSVEVKNTGKRAGDEVVQVYLSDLAASTIVPARKLVAFKRVTIPAGKSKAVKFTLAADKFAFVNDEGKKVVEPGEFLLSIGGGQPGVERWGGSPVVSAKINIKGEVKFF